VIIGGTEAAAVVIWAQHHSPIGLLIRRAPCPWPTWDHWKQDVGRDAKTAMQLLQRLRLYDERLALRVGVVDGFGLAG